MRIERISSIEALQPYEQDWHRLAKQTPFVSWNWIQSWWRAFQEDHQLYVLLAFDDDTNEVLAIAPWFMATSSTRGRRIKFLGSGFVCTDYVQVLVAPENTKAVAREIGSWLAKANADNDNDALWDFLSFEGLQLDEPTLGSLRGSFEMLGHTTHDDESLDCWRLELGATFDEYLATLGSKSRRRKVRDVRKKYIDVGRTEFEVAQNERQFEEFYQLFLDLHQMRRTSLGDCGCFACPNFAKFLRDAAEQAFQDGNLILTRLIIDNEPAACSLGFLNSGIHYMYQTGMNPDSDQHSPGWVMNVHNILYAIENGLTAIDFMRGDEPYKERLGARPVPMAKFRIVANRAASHVLDKAWQLKSGIKRSGIKQNLPSLGAWMSNSNVELNH